MATVPFVFLRTELAVIVAKAGAQPFATRVWTPVVRFDVGWWPDSILVDDVENVAIGTMIELLARRLLAMFVGKVFRYC
jgi:hypothetical protein